MTPAPLTASLMPIKHKAGFFLLKESAIRVTLTWRRVCGGWECGLCAHSPWVWILALWPWTRYLTTPGSSFLWNGEKNHTHLIELGGLNEIIHRKHSAIVSVTNCVNSEVSSVKQKWLNSMAELRSSSSRSGSLVLCWNQQLLHGAPGILWIFFITLLPASSNYFLIYSFVITNMPHVQKIQDR